MWEWGKQVAEQAAAASWTSWQVAETEPTVVEAEQSVEDSAGDGLDICAPAWMRGFELVG